MRHRPPSYLTHTHTHSQSKLGGPTSPSHTDLSRLAQPCDLHVCCSHTRHSQSSLNGKLSTRSGRNAPILSRAACSGRSTRGCAPGYVSHFHHCCPGMAHCLSVCVCVREGGKCVKWDGGRLEKHHSCSSCMSCSWSMGRRAEERERRGITWNLGLHWLINPPPPGGTGKGGEAFGTSLPLKDDLNHREEIQDHAEQL